MTYLSLVVVPLVQVSPLTLLIVASKVAIVERDDFSSGTSSKSTKLVHGGVRYLEKAVWNLDYNQYLLVKEALKERKYFLQTAPHLSSWLPIMLPLDKWCKAPYYWAGTKFYDFLVGSEGIEGSYFLTRSKALEAFPMLKPTDLVGSLVYYDVKDLVSVKDGQSAKPITVDAKSVINCTGPFTDSVRKMDDPGCKEIMAPGSGVHVVLPGYFSPGKMGLIDPSTSDGRVIFFLPWQGNTIAGTTDSPSTITQNPLPDEKSIEWILSEANGRGVRRLGHSRIRLEPQPVTDAPRVSGTDLVDDGAILDGKCQTHKVRLVGAHGFSPTLFIPINQHFGVETEVAKHLTESYGDRAWTVASLCKLTDKCFPARSERISQLYPFVDGEIRYAIRHEYAQTAVDVLAQRERLAFLNAQTALEALP
ncbi:hypothetical protein J7337_011767 [Fusarium musae]|uniref:glycerol-3-phosphate dehydrogenase n=1 Tax=Fusarium musae TaxID=1042133 RepID=A0A9P8D7Z7_9HYPO|nr:hypothetical protein J7337_011767 [Fusarium musae]KAG9496978.1 hypothetical protein J7337_011767 [Fusarium musae]